MKKAGRFVTFGGLILLMIGCIERTFIFFPDKFPVGNWHPQGIDFEDAWFETSGGLKLHGWFVPASHSSDIILFAHGNAGNLSHRAGVIKVLTEQLGTSVMIFDYRGYGRSEGSPTVSGVLEDGEAARAWLSQRTGRRPEEIILMGRSLGAAVVTHMAAKVGARALILESVFSSFIDVAALLYPFLPARLLLRQDIHVEKLIRDYKGPLFQSHGTADRTIAFELGKKVFAAANEPKVFVALPGLDHNDPLPADYYQKLQSFIRTLAKPER